MVCSLTSPVRGIPLLVSESSCENGPQKGTGKGNLDGVVTNNHIARMDDVQYPLAHCHRTPGFEKEG